MPPNPCGFSSCRLSPSCLASRLAEGVVLLSNPTPSSRPARHSSNTANLYLGHPTFWWVRRLESLPAASNSGRSAELHRRLSCLLRRKGEMFPLVEAGGHIDARFTAIKPFFLPNRVALGMKPPARNIPGLRPILRPGPDWLVAAAAEQTARRPGPQSEVAVTRRQTISQK